MHNKLDYLITLTTRTNIADRDTFAAMVSEFISRMKQIDPLWDCVTVMERQSRGAWHAHLAVAGWQTMLMVMKAEWRSICDDGGGAVNVKPPPGVGQSGHAQWDQVRLANYLTKYISKAVGEDHILDKKTYWHTRGIDDPPVTPILVEIGSEEYWANYLVQFIPGRRKHTWSDYNGAIGRVANF